MVKFGKQLVEQQNPDWRYAYLNYEALKLQLELMAEARKRGQALEISLFMFQQHVDAEVASMGDFYVVKIAQIQSKIIYLNGRKQTLAADLNENISRARKLAQVEHELQLWREVAKEVKDLTDFAALNIAAVRKIEKKFIKNFGDESVTPLGKKQPFKIREQKIEQFLSETARNGFDRIQNVRELEEARHVIAEAMAQLYGRQIFLSGKRILQKRSDNVEILHKQANFASTEIRKNLASSYTQQDFNRITEENDDLYFKGQIFSASLPPALDKAGPSGIQHILDTTDEEQAEIQPSAYSLHSRPLALTDPDLSDDQVKEAWKLLMEQQKDHLSRPQISTLGDGINLTENYDHIIYEMIEALEKVQVESNKYQQQQHLEAYAGIFTPAPKDSEAVATLLGLCLNLGSTLLFMANYNIVIPLIGPLCKQLGFPKSFGGLIIGCADVTAMAAAFVYSKWTNTRFKIPLLFTCLMLIISNVLFSLSYDLPKWTGMSVLLVARLFTGFGSARSINRRYIAEFVSEKNRTPASVAFVAASGAGMALGPLLAAPLSKISPKTVEFLGHEFTIDQITVSGYLMFFVWLVYFTITITFFKEPRTEIGIEDLVKLSQQENAQQGGVGDAPSTPLLEGGRRDQFSSDLSYINSGVQNGNLDQITIEDREQEIGVIVESPSNQDQIKKRESIIAVGVCILMLFMLKLSQQGTISSTAIFETPLTHGKWDTAEVGIYLACLNLAMLPVNFLVARISPYISDRMVMLVGLILVFLGCSVILTFFGSVLILGRYLGGTITIVVATTALEGVSTSLLSKKVTPEMKKGTFNAGLLSTISGSVGRFLGNMGILLLGYISSAISNNNQNTPSPIPSPTPVPSSWDSDISEITVFGNLLFGLFDIVVVISIIIYFSTFRKLAKTE